MKKIVNIIFLFLFFFFSTLYGKYSKRNDYVKKVYQWFVQSQYKNGLVPSSEGRSSCFTYDQALSAMIYTLFKDYSKARKIFDFFQAQASNQEKSGFIGFADMYEKYGNIGGPSRAAGPNAWMILAINYYTYKTKDKKYLPLAITIADWLLSLEGIDGGITGGYNENNKAFGWISTEHNLDCYSAFRDLYILTKKEKYLKAAKKILIYLEKILWYEREKRFFNGVWDPNYATDTSSWAVCSLGKKYAKTLDFAIKKSLCSHKYERNNVLVKGFDFGATYYDSHYPDKDAVWIEGTAQMVIAFHIADQKKQRDYYLKQIEKTITPSAVFEGTLGLPYASNLGTPAGSGWIMCPEPLCVSSAAWYLFAVKNFNPFCIKNLEESNNLVRNCKVNFNYNFIPVIDNFNDGEIKILTAYPSQLILMNDAKVDLRYTDDAAEGKGAMRIHFTPGHIYKFLHSIYWSAKDTKSAWCEIRRKFVVPQNWEKFNSISFYLKGEGAPQKFKLKIIDKDSECWQTKEIITDNKEWKKYTFYFNKDFSIDAENLVKKGNIKVDLDQIKEYRIFIKQGMKSYESDIYLDEIKLENLQGE